MQPVRILVVDDTLANDIAGGLRDLWEPDWMGQQLLEVDPVEDWGPETRITELYDLAVFDVRNDYRKTKDGQNYAAYYAFAKPSSLVIVKTTWNDLTADLRDLLGAIPNIRIAADTDWLDKLEAHVAKWMLSGRVSENLRQRYNPVTLTLPAERRGPYIANTKNVDAHWFAKAADPARRAECEAFLGMLGKELRTCAPAIAATAAPYISVPVDSTPDWLAAEPILYSQPSMSLDTPISYVMPPRANAPAARRPFSAASIQFVYDERVSWRRELESLQSVITMIDPEAQIADPMRYEDFLLSASKRPTDILHFAVHGSAQVGAASEQKRLLLRATRYIKPALVVLNSCHGIYSLLDGGQRYPMPVTPLDELFQIGIESVVTTQFLLDDVTTPEIWARFFYHALALTGDAAIAVGVARRAVAERTSSFTEISTLVISRDDSRFVARTR